MSMPNVRFVIAALILAAACGCRGDRGVVGGAGGSAESPSEKHVRGGRSNEVLFELAAVQDGGPGAPLARLFQIAGPDGSAASGGEPAKDQKLILTASYRVEVEAADSSVARIKRAVIASGGYIAREEWRIGERDVPAATVVCRVPGQSSRAFLDNVARLGKVEFQEEHAEDITESYVDLEARLANQKKLEESLQSLMTRKAELSDLISLERELARVRGEIESLEGRKRLWDRLVAYATVTIEMHERYPVIAAASGGVGSRLSGSFKDAGENFVGMVGAVIAGAGALIPLAIVFGGAALIFRAALRRARRGRPAGRIA